MGEKGKTFSNNFKKTKEKGIKRRKKRQRQCLAKGKTCLGYGYGKRHRCMGNFFPGVSYINFAKFQPKAKPGPKRPDAPHTPSYLRRMGAKNLGGSTPDIQSDGIYSPTKLFLHFPILFLFSLSFSFLFPFFSLLFPYFFQRFTVRHNSQSDTRGVHWTPRTPLLVRPYAVHLWPREHQKIN